MGKLSNVSAREAINRFGQTGYFVDHQTGSHIILYNPKPGALPLSIPNHKELAPGLLRAQIKRAGMTIEEFIKLK